MRSRVRFQLPLPEKTPSPRGWVFFAVGIVALSHESIRSEVLALPDPTIAAKRKLMNCLGVKLSAVLKVVLFLYNVPNGKYIDKYYIKVFHQTIYFRFEMC